MFCRSLLVLSSCLLCSVFAIDFVGAKSKDGKVLGRFPVPSIATPACCSSYTCPDDGGDDCREFYVPEGMSEASWGGALSNAFGADILQGPRKANNPAWEAPKPGDRAVSLATLKKVLAALEEMASSSGDKTLHVRKRVGHEIVRVGRKIVRKIVTKKLPVRDLTMHEVNGIVVMPLTASVGKSFASYVGGGKPDFFVSHNWSGRFETFVKGVEAHFNWARAQNEKNKATMTEENTYYWVCTFANNQWHVKSELGEKIDEGPFALAIDNVIQTGKHQIVSIQDDELGEGEYITLGRIWCAFEMFFGILKGADTVFVASSSGAVIQNGYIVTPLPRTAIKCKAWVTKMKDWNITGTAGWAPDKEKILQYMEDHAQAFEDKIRASKSGLPLGQKSVLKLFAEIVNHEVDGVVPTVGDCRSRAHSNQYFVTRWAHKHSRHAPTPVEEHRMGKHAMDTAAIKAIARQHYSTH